MKKDNTMKKKDVTDINGTKVFVENGEVKTILNEEIESKGFMTLEDSYQIGVEQIRKIYEMDDAI